MPTRLPQIVDALKSNQTPTTTATKPASNEMNHVNLNRKYLSKHSSTTYFFFAFLAEWFRLVMRTELVF